MTLFINMCIITIFMSKKRIKTFVKQYYNNLYILNIFNKNQQYNKVSACIYMSLYMLVTSLLRQHKYSHRTHFKCLLYFYIGLVGLDQCVQIA